MGKLTLTKDTIKLVLDCDSHEPRSVLGFHEVRQGNNQQVWIVRVLERMQKRFRFSGKTRRKLMLPH